MLQYVGSYDFGGLTTSRTVPAPKLKGKSGHLFVFVVRQWITRDDGDECLFRFEPAFVDDAGQINHEAAHAAVTGEASGEASHPPSASPAEAFEAARRCIEAKAELWWDDEVEFVGLSWTSFV